MSLEACHPASPRRAPDWRWRAATGIRSGLLPAHCGWADVWVGRAVALQDALGGRDGDPNHPPRRAGPVLAAAHALWLGGDRPARWHVEALLLAGEGDASSPGAAASRPGPSPPTRVPSSTSGPGWARSYILHQVIDVNRDGPGTGPAGPGGCWATAAGPSSSTSWRRGGQEDPAAVGPAAPRGRDARLRRLVVAALTLDLDAESARRLDPLLREWEGIDGRASAASNDPIAASFAAMAERLVSPGRPGRGDEGSAARGESRPVGADPEGVAEHAGRADLGRVAPRRRVGS